MTSINDSPVEDGSLGFSSVVTSGFHALDDYDDVPADFKCNGDVRLSAVADNDDDDDDETHDCDALCAAADAHMVNHFLQVYNCSGIQSCRCSLHQQ